jgi:hypothetical protein
MNPANITPLPLNEGALIGLLVVVVALVAMCFGLLARTGGGR